MDLQSFIAVVWRRRLVVAVATVLALAATIAGLFLITPLYTASTTLRMGTANTGSSGWVSYDLQYSDRLMNTYRTMVTRRGSMERRAAPRLDEIFPVFSAASRKSATAFTTLADPSMPM